jgi:hypothetical protein
LGLGSRTLELYGRGSNAAIEFQTMKLGISEKQCQDVLDTVVASLTFISFLLFAT